MEVEYVGPLEFRRGFRRRAAARLLRLAPGHHHLVEEPGWARSLARQVDGYIEQSRPDAVVSPGTFHVAHVRPGIPLLVWADATFAALVDYHPEYSAPSAFSRWRGNALERRAMRRAERLVFASEWAAASAVADYDADPGKISVIPFGSNLLIQHGRNDVSAWIDERPREHCRLLLVGGDWERKGVEVAIGAAVALNQADIQTTLTVVGAVPPVDFEVPPCVQITGPLPRGRALSMLFRSAHFLVLPTRNEAFGVVFSEASAFGVPSVASNTGGVPSAIADGRNGRLLPPGASSAEYAATILDLFSDAGAYRRLALSAYREYEQRLNWATAGRRVRDLLETIVYRATADPS